MKVYEPIRDWVDRRWRAPGLQWKILLLPVIAPFLAISMIGSFPGLMEAGWAWFALWNGFVFWRFWLYLRAISQEGNKQFDRVGKFRLAREYHDTESATAAAKGKRNG